MKDERSQATFRTRAIQSLREVLARPKWRRSKPIRWTIGVALTLAIAALFPSAHTIALSGYSAGSLWTNADVTAPFTFPVYKDGIRYGQDVRKALQDLHPVYVPDTNAPTTSVQNFRRNWDHLMALLALARADSLGGVSLLDSAKALGLSNDDWTILASTVQSQNEKQFERNERDWADVESFIVRQIGDVESMRFITAGKQEETSSDSKFFALRTRPNEESLIARDSLLTVQGVANRIYDKLEIRIKRGSPVLHPLSVLVLQSLVPTVAFNPALTEESRQSIVDRVPTTEGLVIEGQKIVEKGEVLTPQIVASLESLSKARLERGGRVAELWRIVGTIGLAGVIVLLMVLYLKFIRRKIYNDNAQILLHSTDPVISGGDGIFFGIAPNRFPASIFYSHSRRLDAANHLIR